MKFILPLAILFLAVSCKKDADNKEVEHVPVPGLVEITSHNQLNSEIEQGVSMIFFHASWCHICQEQRPAVSEVAVDEELSGVFFGEVEYDNYTDIVEAFNVGAFPSLLFFKDGIEVDRLTGGGNTAAAIKQIIQQYL